MSPVMLLCVIWQFINVLAMRTASIIRVEISHLTCQLISLVRRVKWNYYFRAFPPAVSLDYLFRILR
jgi:hypothetical protein